MVVTFQTTGQLGNRLFHLSHVIANAIENDLRVIDFSLCNYAHHFPATLSKAGTRCVRSVAMPLRVQKIVTLPLKVIGKVFPKSKYHRFCRHESGREFDLTDPGFIGFAKGKGIALLDGWLFRDYGGQIRHAEAIREIFRPEESQIRNSVEFLGSVDRSNTLLVGVHIRRGDYASWHGGKYLYGDETYAALMLYIKRLLSQEFGKEVKFVICSNETVDLSAYPDLDAVCPKGSYMEDINTLSGCDYLIGPPSTFSGWASFYGDTPLFVMKDAKALPSLEDFSITMG